VGWGRRGRGRKWGGEGEVGSGVRVGAGREGGSGKGGGNSAKLSNNWQNILTPLANFERCKFANI